MIRSRQRRLLGGLLCALAVPAFAKPNTSEPWEAGVSFFTTSGDYGTDSKTTTTYIPFSLRRNFTPGHLDLIIPFLSVTSEGRVVVIGGVPNKRGNAPPQGGGATVERETHSGLGDVMLKGTLYGVDETDTLPQIDVVAKIKLPTASPTYGLGTGHFDEGGGLEFFKTLHERYVALADVGYMVIGGETLRNQWSASLGGGYYLIPDRWIATLSYEERRALIEGETNPRDLFAFTEFKPKPNIRLHAGLQFGLTDTTADIGLLLGGRLAF